MSNFREAVAAWNARFKDEGWRQAPEELECPTCKQPRRIMLTTIHGKTYGHCATCAYDWKVE